MYFTNGIIIYQGDMRIGDREATKEEIAAHLDNKQKETINASILAQIEVLEKQQARPIRELQLDATNEFAKNKLAQIDLEIAELRKQLI